MYRAIELEKALGTKSKIYYKYEGVSPAGSHKPNTAVPQAYYNMKEGVKKISTETGAGQWGSALSFACNLFGIECEVFMVKVSYEGKPYRKTNDEHMGRHSACFAKYINECGKKHFGKRSQFPRKFRHCYF
jgi:tryptophan synthase beta chain